VINRFKTEGLTVQTLFSFLAALCLHGLLVAAALYWPANSAYKPALNLPVLNLTQMTIGRKAPQPQKNKAAPEVKKEAAAPVAPVTPASPAAPEAEPVPVPKIEETKAVEPIKQEDTAKPAEQPKPVEKPVEKPKPVAKPTPTPSEVLSNALRQAEQDTKKDLLAAALNSAREDSDKQNDADGGDTYSEFLGDGVGVLAMYRDSVISRIKPHFTTRPRADGKIFEIRVIIDIAEDGTVTKVIVVMPSEDSTFDQNLLRAIDEAGVMEPPPGADEQRVPVIFTSDMFGG
jgi:protein TonB